MRTGRPKKYTREMKLTNKQIGEIISALKSEGRILIKNVGLLSLRGLAKRRCYHPTFKKVVSFSARRKINLRALGDFYKTIQKILQN